MSQVTIKPPVLINNKTALTRKLQQLKLNYDWIERLDLINDHGSDLPDEEVDHDFNREMLFYRQAQAAVLEGLKRLHSLGVKTKRPADYFAEMAKSDEHMKKVRQALTERESALEKIEKARKLRKERKMAKMVQVETTLAKQKEKKVLLDKIAKYRKGTEKSLDFLNETKKSENKKKTEKKLTKKAAYKKQKYGMGGQKKRSKYNTKESSSDVSQFSKRRNSSGRKKGGGGKAVGGRGKSKKVNRPGKARRAMMKKSKK